ncbi:MAG: 2-amino-4-hydroxy-6-hydroxymethyldihydropteridine diphosphokinase [Oscillospiraceae bacterium]|nr:2-amino-4-hydroxy-6-hydroxymethyldihydropteridine diphosphokinase [Oscillospiraceae bacterium]
MIELKEAVIALGSNLGDREANIKKAVRAMCNIPWLKFERVSSVYETVPLDTPDNQENYYNCCAVVQTELEPEALLGVCFGIEATLGRVRTHKNASRVVDLDLLLYEGKTVNKEILQLPHPKIAERAFVLLPLKELYPKKLPLFFKFAMQEAKVDYGGILSKKDINLLVDT